MCERTSLPKASSSAWKVLQGKLELENGQHTLKAEQRQPEQHASEKLSEKLCELLRTVEQSDDKKIFSGGLKGKSTLQLEPNLRCVIQVVFSLSLCSTAMLIMRNRSPS